MFKIVINDITNYMSAYFFKSILIGLVCSTILYLILIFFKNRNTYNGSIKRIYIKSIAFFLAIVYGSMVVGITYMCREPVFEKKISLIPFSAPLGNARLMAYLVENILLFIPYGLIIPVLIRCMGKWYKCLCLGIITSICIETAQYVTARGYAQIDDVVFNTAGMMIGWCVYKIISVVHKKRKAKKEE